MVWPFGPIHRIHVLRLLRHRMGTQNRGNMTAKQLRILSELSKAEKTTVGFIQWTLDGCNDEDIMKLQEEDYIFVSLGGGFIGGLREISLTPKGQHFIKDYCDCCECMPCDCDWGA